MGTDRDIQHVREIMDERDKRYEERFRAQNEALTKQLQGTDERFRSVNELRGAMADAAKLYMPRAESLAQYEALTTALTGLSDRIAALARRMDLREGESAGSRENKGDSRSLWALVIAVSAVIIQVAVTFAVTR